MNVKKYLLASLAVFVVFEALDVIIHTFILGGMYRATAGLWRPDMAQMMWIMLLTTAALSLLFVYIFAKGYEGKGLMEGVRFGLVIGLLLSGVGAFNQYVVYPVPLTLVLWWVVFGVIEFIAAGLVAALVYRPKA
jgi:hypothetical protein